MRTNLIVVLPLLSLLSIQGYSQHNISGKIIQRKEALPLEFASIVINTEDSVFITGTTSDPNGTFEFKNIPPGNYYIAITCIGFIPEHITIRELAGALDLGDITVEEETALLEAVTVTASSMTNKVDRWVVFVTDQHKAASSNGIDLLATTRLPRLMVNPLMGTISLPGEEEIQLCINGAKVEESDIKNLKPDEIIRIEYIDNPGVRYGDAAVVINYILKRATAGGSIGVSTMNALTTLFGNEQVTFKINRNKSEIGFSYSGRFRELDKAWADKVSRFNFPDGEEMIRYENGTPGKWKENTHQFTLNYSFLDENHFFHATARHSLTDMDKMTRVNQHTSLHPSRITSVYQGAITVQHLPSIDLYYSRTIKESQNVIFNAVGTYIHSDVQQIYEEVDEDTPIAAIISDVIGKKYSLIGEGIYEKTYANHGRFTAGLKHIQAFANNEYGGTMENLAKMDQSESFAYAEYTGKTGQLGYVGGAGVSRSWIKQEGMEARTDYIFRPKITLQYNFKPALLVRLKGEVYNTTPSLAQVSDVTQYIDTLRVTKGNPALKAHVNYLTGLTFSWNKDIFGINYDASFRYSPHAIMESVHRENDLFVGTFENQISWQKFNNELTLDIKPIKNMLTLSLTGGINHYGSKGNRYEHTHTNYYYRFLLMFMYKKFIAHFSANNAYNNLWGETLSGGESTQQLSVMYNQGKFTLGTGIISPFSGKYKRTTENMNRYSSYVSHGYINNLSRMITIHFSWNFDFGRKTKSENRRINNADNDTGIIRVNQ